MPRLVVATRNRGKVAEMAGLLAGLGFDVTSLLDMPDAPDVQEDSESFEGNAVLKAEAVAKVCGCPALADDSGLVVDALGGRPGVLSARYGGDGLSDEQRYRLLLDELLEIPERDRTARFVCALAFCEPGSEPVIFRGLLEGNICGAPSGSHGFGYDPIFVPTGMDRTLAEIPPTEKKQISHRARALAALKTWMGSRKFSDG